MLSTFQEQSDSLRMLRGRLSSQEQRITSKIAVGSEAARKRLRGPPESPAQEGLSPSLDCWIPSMAFLSEFRIRHFLDLFPLLLPSSLFFFFFMAPGGGEERKEINIVLIKMQFYKYFFHLMLQELNTAFLFLGCLLADWQRQRLAQEREIFPSSD